MFCISGKHSFFNSLPPTVGFNSLGSFSPYLALDVVALTAQCSLWSPMIPVFCSLAAYLVLAFVGDNRPFFLILSFKALLLFRVSRKLEETDPGPYYPFP